MEEKQKVDKTSMGYKMGQFLFFNNIGMCSSSHNRFDC